LNSKCAFGLPRRYRREMSSAPPDDGDTAEIGAWAAAREQQRAEQEILRRIRDGRHGKTTAAIAQELRREFAAARIPQPPEHVRDHAQAITEHRWPAVHFIGQLVDIAAHRRIPSGMRLEEHRLPGEQWVPVRLTDTAMARVAVRNFRRLQGFTRQVDPSAPLRARLISTPGTDGREQVAVLLGTTFAGTLPAERAATLIPAIDEADAANRKLTVGARIDEEGTLFVSVPR
jgi:hypothetical protein